MLTKKEAQQVKNRRTWDVYCESKKGRESAEWTRALMLLDGLASDGQYKSNEGSYASYDGAFAMMVKPYCKLIVIKGEGALKAYNEAVSKIVDQILKAHGIIEPERNAGRLARHETLSGLPCERIVWLKNLKN